MRELQGYLRGEGGTGPSLLAVRAVGYVGATPDDFKNDPSFRIPWE
jgi:hypothetical protein